MNLLYNINSNAVGVITNQLAYFKEKPMFAYNSFIDTVQTGKKTFVNMFISDEKVRAPLNAFVDAQTVFVKQIVKSYEDLAVHTTSEIKKKVKAA
jgi:hypothetical protein